MSAPPLGFCQCGCGERTAVPVKSETRSGRQRGVPVEYRRGHRGRGRMKPNDVRIEGDVAYVTLSKGKVAMVDAADLPLVQGFRWWATKGVTCRSHYAAASPPMVDGVRPGNVAMHRLILGATDPEVQVDHINRNGLDNRRENLRLVDAQANQANKAPQRNNTSGYIGVGWHSRQRRWRAYITVKGRHIHLGTFGTAVEAARARDVGAVEHFGAYANLNLPNTR